MCILSHLLRSEIVLDHAYGSLSQCFYKKAFRLKGHRVKSTNVQTLFVRVFVFVCVGLAEDHDRTVEGVTSYRMDQEARLGSIGGNTP